MYCLSFKTNQVVQFVQKTLKTLQVLFMLIVYIKNQLLHLIQNLYTLIQKLYTPFALGLLLTTIVEKSGFCKNLVDPRGRMMSFLFAGFVSCLAANKTL